MANKQEISATPQNRTSVDILKAPSLPRDPNLEAHRQLANIVGSTTREVQFSENVAIKFSQEISLDEKHAILDVVYNSNLKVSETVTGGLGNLTELKQAALKLPADERLSVALSNIEVTKDKNGHVVLTGKLPGKMVVSECVDLTAKADSSAKISTFIEKFSSAISKSSQMPEDIQSSFEDGGITIIGGADKLVEIDKTKVPNPKGVAALKEAIGTGAAVLQIEDKNGKLKLLNIYAEDIPKLETGAMIIHGRIVDMTIQKSLEYSPNAELAASCATGAFGFQKSIEISSSHPGMAAALTCTTPPMKAKGNQPVAYLPLFQGLDDPKSGMVIYHEPHRQIKSSNKVLSPDGTASLTPEERKTVESYLEGGAEIEKMFGAPKGAVAKNVTVMPGAEYGPHVSPTDLLSIRVEEDAMLRINSDQAKTVGRHETVHLFDMIFHLTEGEDSKLNQFWNKLTKSADKGASFFSRINESTFYMLANGGHSQDNPMELLASSVNAMLHPKLGDILARETAEFRKNFIECMEAVKADIVGVGIFSSAPIIKRLDQAIIAAKTSTERVRY